MHSTAERKFDPRLDLVIEREIDVPPALVWAAWTQPQHIRNWFTPKPWMVTDCEIDLRPGGVFRTVMRGPEGEEAINHGCYLEIVPNRRLIWTDALLPGYRPSSKPFITGIVEMEAMGSGTRYSATAMHQDEATRNRHEELGFFDGWGTVTDQMIELIRTMQVQLADR